MTWSPEHVALVHAAIEARDLLRAVLPELALDHRKRVGDALARLNQGLKARAARKRSENTQRNENV